MAVKEQQSFLLFANLAGALARSQQMATNMGCDGVNTIYWHQCVQLTNGQGALCVDPGPTPFGTRPGATALQQLTPAEISALVPWTTVQPFWPPGAVGP